MIKVVHCKKEKYDIYIGRPSIYGNPFTHIGDKKTKAQFLVTTRLEAIKEFENYARERIKKDEVFKKAIIACKDKILGCWCKPKDCHGDVFEKLIKEIEYGYL